MCFLVAFNFIKAVDCSERLTAQPHVYGRISFNPLLRSAEGGASPRDSNDLFSFLRYSIRIGALAVLRATGADAPPRAPPILEDR